MRSHGRGRRRRAVDGDGRSAQVRNRRRAFTGGRGSESGPRSRESATPRDACRLQLGGRAQLVTRGHERTSTSPLIFHCNLARGSRQGKGRRARVPRRELAMLFGPPNAGVRCDTVRRCSSPVGGHGGGGTTPPTAPKGHRRPTCCMLNSLDSGSPERVRLQTACRMYVAVPEVRSRPPGVTARVQCPLSMLDGGSSQYVGRHALFN